MDEEIKRAREAIAAGHDPVAVAAMFREITGQDLPDEPVPEIASSTLPPKVGGALDFISSAILPAAAKFGFMPREAQSQLAELQARAPEATRIGGAALPAVGSALLPFAAGRAIGGAAAASRAPGMLLHGRMMGKATPFGPQASPVKDALSGLLRNRFLQGGAAGGLAWQTLSRMFGGQP